MRVGFGIGIVIGILLPVALFLFGLLSFTDALAGVFLLVGLWTLAFGMMWGRAADKLYNAGWGLVIATFSSLAVLPLRYFLGLELVVVIAMTVIYAMGRSSRKQPSVAPPNPFPSKTA